MGFSLLSLLGLTCGWLGTSLESGNLSFLGGFLLLDDVGLYLCFISLLFFLTFCVVSKGDIGFFEGSCLMLSMVFSVACFTSGNTILFWVCYELSIIPLLVSLYSNSPYSERYLAGWYLVTYVLLTSLPMLLTIFYVSAFNGSFNVADCGKTGWGVEAFLFLLFITKVPLPPFHAWLPVVHAEASTYASVCLSGYVMKLGIIGVYRFCFHVVSDGAWLILIMFYFSILFFFCSGCELDTKRWLAFLSLSHILVSLVGLYFLNSGELFLSMLYCLGHGLSAGLLFYMFFNLYGVSGTRNWLLVSLGDMNSLLWRVIIVLGLLTVSSFPPSMSFMTEVYVILSSVGSVSILYVFSFYLFLGGLVPMVLMSSFVCNVSSYGVVSNYYLVSSVVILSLFLVWFFGGLLI